jgi:hypothetical protein
MRELGHRNHRPDQTPSHSPSKVEPWRLMKHPTRSGDGPQSQDFRLNCRVKVSKELTQTIPRQLACRAVPDTTNCDDQRPRAWVCWSSLDVSLSLDVDLPISIGSSVHSFPIFFDLHCARVVFNEVLLQVLAPNCRYLFGAKRA